LHEHQGKALLARHGIAVPEGGPVSSAPEAARLAARLGGPVAIKAQAWVTGRAARGGVQFAQTPEQAEAKAAQILSMKLGNFPVTEVLIERKLNIEDELFVSLTVDDAHRCPILLLDAHGGSGIEERAGSVQRIPVDVRRGVDLERVREVLRSSPLEPARHDTVVSVIAGLVDMAGQYEARSIEVNPLVITTDGDVVAADCRMTIDDYAVYRHSELDIEVAREFDHPATNLERIAYRVGQADHRGTFYFVQLSTEGVGGAQPAIAFHGAGGGGSMMSMDAISRYGYTLANFCDTSGNPSAAKVYRAARLILAQSGLVGYFGSGSGVASQEQYHSAYGLAKAFCELNLTIPAVIRLGGNGEDRAVEILQDACRHLPGPVEGYRKDDTPAFIAKRFAQLVEQAGGATWTPRAPLIPDFVGRSYHFSIRGGTVWIDRGRLDPATTALVVAHGGGLLKERDGRPELAVTGEEVEQKDSELVALEVECRRAGRPVVFVDLEIPGLEEERD
jgi:succinyl-CoA synthetase beta subunit